MTNQPDKILLVDDDSLARLLTRTALEERGFAVCEADGGESALDMFAIESPHIVLLDALMSGIDGFETCKSLRQLPSAQHVPVLMLTGLDDEVSVARAYEAGANDFFVKSTQWTLLAQRVRYLLRASRTQAELAKSESRIAKAQRIAGLGIWEWVVATSVIYPSRECRELVDLDAEIEELHISRLWDLMHPDDRKPLQIVFRRLIEGQSTAKFDCRLKRRDGSWRIVHFEAEVELDARGKAVRVHGISQDITDRREAEDRISHLANYDSLTGLPNRRLFREQLGVAIERARKDRRELAVLFLDLDNFKRINDTLGHHAGDQLLNEVAYRLTNSVRPSDAVARISEAEVALTTQLWANRSSVARLGGDEFTVILDRVEDANATEAIAKRILYAMQQPIILSGQECFMSASIGIAMYPRDGDTVDAMLRNADLAMYAAKEAGRNSTRIYTPHLDSATHRKLEVSNALHKAIERGELRLHFQPQVDTLNGRVIAAEALMRWQREDRLVPPDEFIPIASETGLILPMGEWAIREACTQIARWRADGREMLPIAVNVSANAFQSDGFVDKIKAALASADIAPKYLELEITETMLMQDLKQSLPVLEELSRLGVSLSVDDFGTGYSSLSYLRKLPIDTLKIDRSFVKDMSEGSDDEAIVAAIVALARALNLRVIAEGVETRAQSDLLQIHGCHLMQGYHFSKPLMIADFNRFIDGTEIPHASAGRSPVMPIQIKRANDAAPHRVH